MAGWHSRAAGLLACLSLAVGWINAGSALASAPSRLLEPLINKAVREANQVGPTGTLATYRKLLQMARQMGARLEEGILWKLIGHVLHDNAIDKAQAIESFKQSLSILRPLNHKGAERGLLQSIGVASIELGRPQEAISAFTQALPLAADARSRVQLLRELGLAHLYVGQSAEGMRFCQQALSTAVDARDREAEGLSQQCVGKIYFATGRMKEALESYQLALPIFRQSKDRRYAGALINGIGAIQLRLGNPEEALRSHRQALAIQQEINDRQGQILTLSNIGVTYSNHGLFKPEEALKYYLDANNLARELRDPLQEGIIFNNIAQLYHSIKRFDDAQRYYDRALAIFRAIGNRKEEGNVLNNMGALHLSRGNAKEAIVPLQQARNILADVGDRTGEGASWNILGGAQLQAGNTQKAIDAQQRAVTLLGESKDAMGKSYALAALAIAHTEKGEYSTAIDNMEQSIAIQLQVRRGLQRKDRQRFISLTQHRANILVALLIAAQRPADAFRWLNQFGTVDLADYSRLIDAKLTDPNAQAALMQWQQRQQALADQRQKLQEGADSRRLQLLVEQEAEQQRQAEALISRYPEIAELLETRPADLQRLQAGIPPGTVVLQPALLTHVHKRPDTAALFVLTRTSLQVVSVPLPAQFNAQLESYRQKLEDNQSYLQQSQQLYDLLIRPVEDRGLLPAGSRLALITSGKLREIPLETLYDSRTDEYLIEKYPIHYLTRLSRTAAPTGQPGASVGNRHALVLANPTPTKVELPGTEAEATYLINTYPGSRDLRGSQATLSSFQQQASRYPILHLGTHGCFIPGGCPALGMPPNTLLFANGVHYPIAEAASLGLTNTELLVLAACQTARLTDDNDVGLSGLAYVWERAGARAVVASLWSARDQESSQINQAFYANLRSGMDKAEAMRQAKLSLLRSTPNGLHPNAWAPFVVIGDAAPLGK